jgi:hypothetical protein
MREAVLQRGVRVDEAGGRACAVDHKVDLASNAHTPHVIAGGGVMVWDPR